MSGVLIIRPEQIAAIVTVGSAAANLQTPDPNEAWIAPSTAALTMDVDLGWPMTLDSIFLGYTNADTAAIWSIASATSPGDGLVTISPVRLMRAADSIGPRHHAFVRLAAPVTTRYLRLTLVQAGGSPLNAGVLLVGLAFEKHREYGPGRTVVDTGQRQDLVSGGFGIGPGVTKALYAFSFMDLLAEELRALWAIKMDRGLRKPVLVVEDADVTSGRNEAIHYGVFERFQAIERANPRESRWSGSVIEWA